jgi:hypothetical protein
VFASFRALAASTDAALTHIQEADPIAGSGLTGPTDLLMAAAAASASSTLPPGVSPLQKAWLTYNPPPTLKSLPYTPAFRPDAAKDGAVPLTWIGPVVNSSPALAVERLRTQADSTVAGDSLAGAGAGRRLSLSDGSAGTAAGAHAPQTRLAGVHASGMLFIAARLLYVYKQVCLLNRRDGVGMA